MMARSRGAWLVTAAAISAVVLDGCSVFALRSTPSKNEKSGRLECGSSVLPGLDLFGAIVLTTALELVGSFSTGLGNGIKDCGNDAGNPCASFSPIPWAIPGALMLGSSVYGFVSASRCKAALGAAGQADPAEPLPTD